MISAADYLFFVDEALDGMVTIVSGLGDDAANRRPNLPGANSPYGILTHCLGVMEYWAGAVVAGRPITRDRDAEFRATGNVADLAAAAGRAQVQLRTNLRDLEPSAPPRIRPPHEHDRSPPTQGGVLLHVYRELAQHRGQLEVCRDALLTQHPDA